MRNGNESVNPEEQRLQEIIATDVAAFNALEREAAMPAIIPVATLYR